MEKLRSTPGRWHMKPNEDLRRRTTSTAGFHVVTEQRGLRCPGPVAQVEPSAATEAVASGFEECHSGIGRDGRPAIIPFSCRGVVV
ncbi:hypothetical protein RB213_012474 [Colletotrichum asianum]